ncbi:MAG TPA: phosphatase PAP2 family protein [Stenomitos sp.]
MNWKTTSEQSTLNTPRSPHNAAVEQQATPYLVPRFGTARRFILLSAGLTGVLFVILTVLVGQAPYGFAWDVALLRAIRLTASPFLDVWAVRLTGLGVSWGVVPLSILLGFGLLYRKYWRKLCFFCLSLLGCAVINPLAKLCFQRIRPQFWDAPLSEFDYSYPSGHAMASMAFVAVIIILVWQSRWRWSVFAIGVGFAATIGWTRLYLGVHYPSDILGGWILSLSWCLGILGWIWPFPQRGDRPSNPPQLKPSTTLSTQRRL